MAETQRWAINLLGPIGAAVTLSYLAGICLEAEIAVLGGSVV